MVLMAGFELPVKAIRQQVSSALELIVHLERLEDGGRRVTSIAEVQRMESDIITLEDLFKYRVEAVRPDRTVVGRLEPTGIKPGFLEKFQKRGVELPMSLFTRKRTPGDPRAEMPGAAGGARGGGRGGWRAASK
jgi:pilus assembly protein CpaF